MITASPTRARMAARLFGGKALIGTARQKKWAEAIRAEKLSQMTIEQAQLACDPAGLLRHARFWIRARNRPGADIGGFVGLQLDLQATVQ